MVENVTVVILIALLALGTLGVVIVALNKRKSSGAFETATAGKIDYDDVQEIELADPSGSTIKLENLPSSQISKSRKFTEVVSSASTLASGLVKTLPSLSIAEFASAGPIFRATGKVADLIRYKNGTVSSMVSKSGKGIDSHAGFKVSDISKLNVAAAVGASMQVMAAISGQYYMSQITKRLDGITNKVSHLVEFHHDEKLGKLQAIQTRLREISIKTNVDQNDIQALQSLGVEAGAIAREYAGRFEGKIAREEFTNITERKVLSKLGAGKDMKALLDELENEELGLTVQVGIFADTMQLELKKAEYATRLKLGEAEKADEVFSELTRIHESSFLVKAPELLETTFEQIHRKADELLAGQWIESSKAKERLENVKESETKLKGFVAQFVQDDNVRALEKAQAEEVEILYLPSSNNSEPRVFVASND